MSRPDDPGTKPLSEYSEADVDALAAKYLAEAAAADIEAESAEAAEAEVADIEAELAEAEAAAAAETETAETVAAEGAEAETPETEATETELAEAEAAAAAETEIAEAAEAETAEAAAGEAEAAAAETEIAEAAEAELAEAEATAAEAAEAEIAETETEAADDETGEPVMEAAVPEEDFLPFTISTSDADGLAITVLDKGTKLPAAVKMNFSAPYKTPSAVKFRLYMGEGIFAKDNILINYIKLPGIKEYKGGITRIVMTLRVERNGDLEIDLLDEGSVCRKHDRIELNFAECREALKDKDWTVSSEDAELRDSYLVIQRGRYIVASAERLLKVNKKEMEKERIVQIREKIKELKSEVKKADPTALTPARKTAMKNQMNEISAMF